MLCNEICESILLFIQDAIIHNCHDIRDTIGHNCFLCEVFMQLANLYLHLSYHFQLTQKCSVCILSIYFHVKYFNKRHNIISIVLWQCLEKWIYIVYIFCSEIMVTMFSSLINTLHNENLWVKNVFCYKICSNLKANFPSSELWAEWEGKIFKQGKRAYYRFEERQLNNHLEDHLEATRWE